MLVIKSKKCQFKNFMSYQEKSVAEAYDGTRSIIGSERLRSKTLHLRTYNNLVKSYLIDKYCPKDGASVLDLASGKGGDIPKWRLKEPSYFTFADVSKNSLVECFKKFRSKLSGTADARFIFGDSFGVRIKRLIPERSYHIASCQFALHYAFESYEKAYQAISNLSSQLLPGGFVIITTVNCFKLVEAFRKKDREAANGTQEERRTIKNPIFMATRHFEIDDIPAFGAAYIFKLEESVDTVKEYLIHPTVLDDLFSIHGMKRVETKDFHEFYDFMLNSESSDAVNARNMYVDICNKLDGKFVNADMTDDEWDVCGLYTFYVYQKEGERVLPEKPDKKSIPILQNLTIINAIDGSTEEIQVPKDDYQNKTKGRSRPLK